MYRRRVLLAREYIDNANVGDRAICDSLPDINFPTTTKY